MATKVRLLSIILALIGIVIGILWKVYPLLVGSVIFFFVMMFVPSVWHEISLGIRDANILLKGADARAELVDINPRSGGNDSSLGVTIKAKVYYPDNTVNIVTIEDCISVVHLPRYVPGYVFDVKYDANDKNKVAIKRLIK